MSPARAPLVQALLRELEDDADARCALRDALGAPPAQPELLDVEAAAAVLGLHQDTLARMARHGRIEAVKVGREWRFRPDRLDVRPPHDPAPDPTAAATPRRRRTPATERRAGDAIRNARRNARG